jgi:hypothetical protein
MAVYTLMGEKWIFVKYMALSDLDNLKAKTTGLA